MKINKIPNKHQLALLAKIPYPTLKALFNPNRDCVRVNTLIPLADFFKVSLDYLVGRDTRIAQPNRAEIISLLENRIISDEDLKLLDIFLEALLNASK
jgi:hypothetical protein